LVIVSEWAKRTMVQEQDAPFLANILQRVAPPLAVVATGEKQGELPLFEAALAAMQALGPAADEKHVRELQGKIKVLKSKAAKAAGGKPGFHELRDIEVAIGKTEQRLGKLRTKLDSMVVEQKKLCDDIAAKEAEHVGVQAELEELKCKKVEACRRALPEGALAGTGAAVSFLAGLPADLRRQPGYADAQRLLGGPKGVDEAGMSVDFDIDLEEVLSMQQLEAVVADKSGPDRASTLMRQEMVVEARLRSVLLPDAVQGVSDGDLVSRLNFIRGARKADAEDVAPDGDGEERANAEPDPVPAPAPVRTGRSRSPARQAVGAVAGASGGAGVGGGGAGAASHGGGGSSS